MSTETQEKKTDQELLIGEGEIELFQQDGGFFLSQGEVAVDVTAILENVNYQMGRITLRIRLTGHKGTQISNSSREWLNEELHKSGPELESHQEKGFTEVARTGTEEADG